MNKLEIVERPVKNTILLEVAGELTAGSGREQLLGRVRDLLEEGEKLLLVDLSACRRVDSSGMGELVCCLVTAAKRGATLRLVRVPQQISGLMQVINVYRIFEIYDTAEGALAPSA